MPKIKKPFVVVINWNDPDAVNAFLFGGTCVLVLAFLAFFSFIITDEFRSQEFILPSLRPPWRPRLF